MKTNTETNMNINPNSNLVAPRWRSRALKTAVVVLSVVALCLAYRAATEAVGLYGMLEKVQDSLAHERLLVTQTVACTQISETIAPVAGL